MSSASHCFAPSDYKTFGNFRATLVKTTGRMAVRLPESWLPNLSQYGANDERLVAGKALRVYKQ